MKALKLAIAASLAFAGISNAGGVQGRVLDENGIPRRNVTISVKGYRHTVSTDYNGFYMLQLPPMFDGQRVNVYVNGKFAVNAGIPQGSANCTVDVDLIRR